MEKETDQENQMVKIWCISLIKSRNVLVREDASGDSGSEFEGSR